LERIIQKKQGLEVDKEGPGSPWRWRQHDASKNL